MILDRHETDAEFDARHRRVNREACLWCAMFGLLWCALCVGFGASVADRPDLASSVQLLSAFGLLMVFAPLGVAIWGGLIDG